jgi:hypothetical protein
MGLHATRTLALSLALCGVGVLALPAVGSAHSKWITPAPRSDSDALTTGPCGGLARGTTATDYAPGQTITVTWVESINHDTTPTSTATFSINFSASGDTNFVALVGSNVPDVGTGNYSRSVTLPSTPTNDGTLQLVYNTTAPGASVYYSCANIRIVAATTPQPTPSPTPSPTPTPAPADTTPPKMAIPATATRKMGTTRTSGQLSFPVQCDEGCTMSAQLRVSASVAKRLGIPTTKRTVAIGSAAASTLAANIRGTLKIKLTKRVRTAMAKAKTFVATLTTKVKDAAGNEVTSTTRVTLK